MKINRGDLLSKLNEAVVGTSTKETIEQSNSFVFAGDSLITFNDDIMVRMANPLDFDAIVNAPDMLGLISSIPDEEIEITREEGEVRLKGKRRSAGIACAAEVHLPISAVPLPEKWSEVTNELAGMLQQAARTCGKDQTQYLCTCVHVTPKLVEACDNFRMFRWDGATGLPSRVLLPATSLEKLEGLELRKVAVGEGWVYFRTASKSVLAVRCSHQKYHDDIDKVLEVPDAQSVTLPSTLKEMIERASIMNTAAYDSRIRLKMADEELTITSRKESGWYRERKGIGYTGPGLEFEVHPRFLCEMLEHARDVLTNGKRMKITNGKVQFVVALSKPTE